MSDSDQKFTLQSCPYLGLHDDQRTSLAYPSVWNYCYRAHPPASVSISHQIAACLNTGYIQCPVYGPEHKGPLPASLRSSSNSSILRRKSARRRKRFLVWSGIIILLLITAAIANRSLIPGSFRSWSLSIASYISKATSMVMIPTGLVSDTQINPTNTGKPSNPLPTATLSIPNTQVQIPLASPTRTPIPKRCGHTLDTPWGGEVKFTLHQISLGENLDKLAVTHQTTMDAIRAVNYAMPVPVWENWIVVIPIGIMDAGGLPSFEPYQADGTIFSLAVLAEQLGTDPQSLSKYNSFTDACTVFRGWLIVPRPSPTPSD